MEPLIPNPIYQQAHLLRSSDALGEFLYLLENEIWYFVLQTCYNWAILNTVVLNIHSYSDLLSWLYIQKRKNELTADWHKRISRTVTNYTIRLQGMENAPIWIDHVTEKVHVKIWKRNK